MVQSPPKCYPLWGHRSHIIGHFASSLLCTLPPPLSFLQPLIIAIDPFSAVVSFQDTIYNNFLTAHGWPGFESRDLWSDVETHLLPSLGAHSYDAPHPSPPRTFSQSFRTPVVHETDRFIGTMAYVTLFYSNLPRLSPLISIRVFGSRLNFLRSPALSTPHRALSFLLPLSPQSFRQYHLTSCSLVFTTTSSHKTYSTSSRPIGGSGLF